MKKDIVPHPFSLRMKAVGFDEPCFGVFYGDRANSDTADLGMDDDYDFVMEFALGAVESQYYAQKRYKDGLLAPTFGQCFRWFRDVHDIEAKPITVIQGRRKWYKISAIIPNKNGEYENYYRYITYDNYEQGELASLVYLIEFIEQSKLG